MTREHGWLENWDGILKIRSTGTREHVRQENWKRKSGERLKGGDGPSELTEQVCKPWEVDIRFLLL